MKKCYHKMILHWQKRRLSMSKKSYILLYYLTVFVHYFVTPGLLYLVVIEKLDLSFGWFGAIWFFVWLGTGLLCNGCPYTYIEEYFAHKAWGTEKTYNFTKSMLYLLIFKHLYRMVYGLSFTR